MRLAAASEAQKRERDLLTWQAWGARLTPEQYLEREARLRAHPWTRAGMATWLLLDDAGQVLASCESFRMSSRLRGPEGAECWGASFGIASVFTEERLRGRGFASRMTALVAERLAAEPDAHAALLFSDVGPEIYARSGGYVARPAVDRSLAAEPGEARAEVDALFTEEAIAAELSRLPLPEDAILVWPTAIQLDWHLERERVYAGLLGRERPAAWGARAGGGAAFWSADFKNDRLVVLLLRATAAGEAAALLRAARRTAAGAGLARVQLWDSGCGVDLDRVEGAGPALARDGGLPMMRPLRAGVRAEQWRSIPRALWV